jgi:flagellar hook-basal body protein
LNVTRASLILDNTNLSAIGNIRIDPRMTLPPKATQTITFTGNLDSFQQATTSGGILDLFPNGQPILPVTVAMLLNGIPNSIDPVRMTVAPTGTGGFALQQVANLPEQIAGVDIPLENGFTNLLSIQIFAGTYAWEQQPPVPPANQISQTVYDSLGNAREVTFQFYQVNDLGAGGINSASGPSQTCYAWYAFDTTGGQAVSTQNLIGGTGIYEGDFFPKWYDRGATANPLQPMGFGGDFLYFNTDGSLASSGGSAGIPSPPGPPNFMSIPRVYLPPYNYSLFIPPPGLPVSPIPSTGAEITPIDIDFGTFGILGVGRRDGLTGDAQGTYQTVNGVNTYVPDSHLSGTQDGYADGQLQGVSFDETGKVIGTFSNGQSLALAQVAMAQVENPRGLNSVGNNYFSVDQASGPVQMGLAGQNGFGTTKGGTLEGSNVDLTVELSNMIVAQRGFQTNARMVSVISDTLQVLTQLGQ